MTTETAKPILSIACRTVYKFRETPLITRTGEEITFERISVLTVDEQLAVLFHLLTIRVDEIRKSSCLCLLSEIENVRDACAACVELPW